MRNYKKSQILMLTLLAALLFVTPLLSSSIRPKYLYFIINLLIIALGVEAGLLSSPTFFSNPVSDHHHQKHAYVQSQDRSDADPAADEKKRKKMIIKVVEKSATENIVKVEKMKKCPSMPSLFFIGSGDQTAGEVVDEDDEVEEHAEEEEISGQELYTKAETFIGNFYKQLKMQREESWKRIHGFYQKAF